jgi:NADH-quinone oxidoreductase subunit F
MEFIPHLLIEGMITSSYALGANLSTSTFVENMWVYKILERAINEAKAAGWFWENILGSGYDLDFICSLVGAYICGEETALLNHWKEKRKSSYQTTISCYFRTLGKSNGCIT